MAGFYGPARDKDDMVDVRCRGCRRQVGVGHGHPMHTFFCSTACAHEVQVNENTERDDLLEQLVLFKGWTANRIAMELGITRQRAHQILRHRALAPPA